MPKRHQSETSYRYAYNGMEQDPEVKGDGNSYTTEFRQYDPRVGRWLSLDPLMHEFPWMSPYVAFNNNPIYFIDPYGLEGVDPKGGTEGNPGNIKSAELEKVVIKAKRPSFFKKLKTGLEAIGSKLRNNIEIIRNQVRNIPDKVNQAIENLRKGADNLREKIRGATEGIKRVADDINRNVTKATQPIRDYTQKESDALTKANRILEEARAPVLEQQVGLLRELCEIQAKIGGSGIGTLGRPLSTVKATSVAEKVVGVAEEVVEGAAKTGFSVNPSKFDYFFGRVTTGAADNIRRSADNLRDLSTLGIKNESQLMRVFNQAFENGTIISTKSTQYGTTITRSIQIGDKGAINVGFFYQGGNMSATPSISTIIPKIYK